MSMAFGLGKKRWFGVKTIYRITAQGKPKIHYKNFNKEAFMIEERVVIFWARDHKNALRRAEREARGYASDNHINPFGQKVVCEYLHCHDVYELFEEPDDGGEVYSRTEVHDRPIATRKLLDKNFGKIMDKEKESQLRLKFRNAQLSNFPRN